MADFTAFWKLATKEVGAFDDLSGTQPENRLFGNDQSDAVHYSDIMAGLIRDNVTKYAALDNWNPNYVDAYAQGISTRDKLGTSIKTRQDMYNPLYYIHQSSAGYGTSTPARHWRINTGLMQGDTALTTEVGLYLDLVQLEGTDVSFTTVWDMNCKQMTAFSIRMALLYPAGCTVSTNQSQSEFFLHKSEHIRQILQVDLQN